MLNMVEIGPGYQVQGASNLGIVEIGPGYGVNGLGAYDDVSLVGTGVGAYDDVSLVGAFGMADDTKKYLGWAGIFLGGLAVGAGAVFMMRR